MSAIVVENLSKCYQIGHQVRHDTLRDALAHRLRAVVSRKNTPRADREDFWALRDVSFTIEPGEVVGVIGRNGAGKSTLLKILSRITEPTRGRVTINGRVASLLEVGTGFHPELSGRENIFLNGAILGMTRAEIRRKFEEIVAFAEVERFLDTPVKRYSSGMYVRLAFAVAAHLEPEILIVDEVLAVGDAQFQKKCLGKMREVAQGQGRTVVFVSHDMAAVSALTQRCVLLSKGSVVDHGPTTRTVPRYLAGASTPVSGYVATERPSRRPHVVSVKANTSEAPGVQAAGKSMEIVVDLDFPEAAPTACLSFQIMNHLDQPATHVWIYGSDRPFGNRAGRVQLTCRIPKVRLNVGSYTLKLYFTEPPGGRIFETPERICPFEVVRLGETTLWGWRPDACAYHEEADWEVNHAG